MIWSDVAGGQQISSDRTMPSPTRSVAAFLHDQSPELAAIVGREIIARAQVLSRHRKLGRPRARTAKNISGSSLPVCIDSVNIRFTMVNSRLTSAFDVPSVDQRCSGTVNLVPSLRATVYAFFVISVAD